ncbi:hypothetical protein Golax_011255, partial [Gossypium laxum]|nr:hypothetical protein [Gossypium laxum]
MKKFTQSRKSGRKVVTIVKGYQVPLYGGIPVLANTREHKESIAVPLNLTFVMRSRGYILGRLVTTKFYGKIRCFVTLKGNKLGKPLNLTDSLFIDGLRFGGGICLVAPFFLQVDFFRFFMVARHVGLEISWGNGTEEGLDRLNCESRT